MNRRNQTSRIVHWTFVLLFSSISLLYLSCSGEQSTGSSPSEQSDSDSVSSLPPSIQQELVSLRAQDGRSSWGVLYTPKDKKPQTALLAMHPRGNQSRNSRFLPLLEAGFCHLWPQQPLHGQRQRRDSRGHGAGHRGRREIFEKPRL